MAVSIERLQLFISRKKFVTRGLPFAKKMWRDGYKKALDDVLNFFLAEIENEKATNPQSPSWENTANREQ